DVAWGLALGELDPRGDVVGDTGLEDVRDGVPDALALVDAVGHDGGVGAAVVRLGVGHLDRRSSSLDRASDPALQGAVLEVEGLGVRGDRSAAAREREGPAVREELGDDVLYRRDAVLPVTAAVV